MSRATLVVLLALCAQPAMAGECEAARLRDTSALNTAITQDRQMAALFSRTAKACETESDACEQARLECGTQLTSIIQWQVAFDEGLWLRDMLLPYMGKPYTPSKPFAPGALAPDTSCGGTSKTLDAAAARRTQQAARRQQLLAEYPLYVKWVTAEQQRCIDGVRADQQRADAEKAEADKVAAAAKAEEDRKKAEEAKKREAEQQAKKDKAEQERLARDAQRKAKESEEAKAVAERRERIEALKLQKKQMVEEAQAHLERLEREAEQTRKAAVQAVSESATNAQARVAAAAAAEQARDQAKIDLEETKRRADAIKIDESFERSKGSVGITLGMGYSSWAANAPPAPSFVLGARASAHLGVWAEPPLKGLGNGFELRLLGTFLQSVAGPRVVEGLLTGTYFFGHFGVGGAVDIFLRPQGLFSGAGGLTLALAIVDSPTNRVLLRAHYTPIGSVIDWARFQTDLEVSVGPVFVSVLASVSSQAMHGVSFHGAGFGGVRYSW